MASDISNSWGRGVERKKVSPDRLEERFYVYVFLNTYMYIYIYFSLKDRFTHIDITRGLSHSMLLPLGGAQVAA